MNTEQRRYNLSWGKCKIAQAWRDFSESPSWHTFASSPGVVASPEEVTLERGIRGRKCKIKEKHLRNN